MPERGEYYRPENSNDQEKRTEKIEYLPGELTELLISDKFIEALTETAKKTRSTESETGFAVFVTEDKNMIIPELVMGTLHKLGKEPHERDYFKTIDGYNGLEGSRVGRLFTLHFHKELIGPITPSLRDLKGLLKDKPRPAFEAVAQLENKNIKILLVRQSEGKRPNLELYKQQVVYEQEFAILGDTVRWDQNEIMNRLKKAGFESFLIEYHFDHAANNYKPDEQSKKLLSQVKTEVELGHL